MARAGIVHPTALSMLGFGLAWTCKGFVNAVITIICVVVQLYLEDIFIQLSPSGSYSLPNTLWKRECNISYPILSIYLPIYQSIYLPTYAYKHLTEWIRVKEVTAEFKRFPKRANRNAFDNTMNSTWILGRRCHWGHRRIRIESKDEGWNLAGRWKAGSVQEISGSGLD